MMNNNRRSRTNNTFFQDIPKPKDIKALAYEKSRALSKLVEQRTILYEETKEKRTRLYNLSLEIHALEQELVELFSIKQNQAGDENDR